MEETVSRNFGKEIEGKRVLVTGGTGSFGHYIVRELMKHKPEKITIFSRDEDKQYKMEMELKSGRLGFAPGDVFKMDEDKQYEIRDGWKTDVVNFALGDVRDFKRVLEVTKDQDLIFHAAALKHVPLSEYHPFEAVMTNVIGAKNVKTAAIRNGVGKVVSISTDKAVKPVNAMGMSKAIQEKIMLADDEFDYSTKFACVRYGNVVGSRGSVIPAFKDKILRNEPLTITDKNMTRFLLTLEDAIELVFYAATQTGGHEIFVKKAPAANIITLSKTLAVGLTGKEDYPIKNIGVRPGEKIHEVLVSEEEMYRAKEEEGFFVIHPHSVFSEKSKAGDKMFSKKSALTEYTSANTTMLDEKGIMELLKRTGWV